MAKKVVNRGLLRIGQQASQSTNYNVARYIRSMSVDDSAVAFAAGDTALNSGGAVTTEDDANLASTPTESGQTIIHTATFAVGAGNMTIKRIALHDDIAANVSSSSATLVAGVDGQSILKDVNFILTLTQKITYTST